ncbi:MerR family DNA-binding transcriptional regulator [Streptomyces sp. NPDC004227]
MSQLAARSGVPATALRFYDGAGLLPADRLPGVRQGRDRVTGVHRCRQTPGPAVEGDR